MLPSIHTLLNKVPSQHQEQFQYVIPAPQQDPYQVQYPVTNQFILPHQEVNTYVQKVKCKFTEQEDIQLNNLVRQFGKNWNLISKLMVTRNPRQCRERWNNYINPELSNLPWTIEEDLLLAKIYAQTGPHWSKIGKYFPRRSDNSIRNRWHALLKRSERRNSNATSSCSSDDC